LFWEKGLRLELTVYSGEVDPLIPGQADPSVSGLIAEV
jgi:hypothetical protein